MVRTESQKLVRDLAGSRDGAVRRTNRRRKIGLNGRRGSSFARGGRTRVVCQSAGGYYRGGQESDSEGELFHVVFFFLPI
jgi:hypothetical protein